MECGHLAEWGWGTPSWQMEGSEREPGNQVRVGCETQARDWTPRPHRSLAESCLPSDPTGI